MPLKHARLLLIASSIAVGVLVAAWVAWPRLGQPSLHQEVLSLAIADVLNTFPVLIAEEKGFFRAEGLDVTIKHFPNGRPALEALLRGEFDVVTVAETPVVIRSFSRHDFVIMAAFSRTDQDGKLVAHPQSGIAAVEDLRGKRVGVVDGTTAHFFLHVLLTDHGLKPGDIIEVPMSAPDIASALKAQRVEAVAIFEPYASQAQAAIGNSGRVFDGGGRTRLAFLYTAARDFPHRRPGAARRLLSATDRSIEWIRSHRQEAIAIVARRTGVAPEVIDMLWDSYRAQLSLDQTLLVSLEEQARWAVRTGQVAPATIPNYLDFIDASALYAVKPEVVMSIH